MTTQFINKRLNAPATVAPLTEPVAVQLPGRTLVRGLVTTACILIPVSAVTQLAAMYSPDFFARDLLSNMFDLGGEANLPSAFSAVIVWLAAALLWAIGRGVRAQHDPMARIWMFLAGVFAYLGLDEFAQLHDRTVPVLRTLLGSHATTGGLHYTWILLFGPLALLVFAATIPFLKSLPSRTRSGMLAAGALYLSGALGLEIVKGFVDQAFGFDSAPMLALITVAESLEIFGVILFISTLLAHWGQHLPGYRMQVGLDGSTGRTS